MSHNFTVRSRLPEARQSPSELHATAVTPPLCPRRVKAYEPLLVNHPAIVLSALAEMMIRPSRPLKATPDTLAWVEETKSCVVSPSHTRIKPAGLPAATQWPSALNATLVQGTILSFCRLKPPTGSRVAVSQAMMFPSWPAVTRRRPSGLKSTAARDMCQVLLARASPLPA